MVQLRVRGSLRNATITTFCRFLRSGSTDGARTTSAYRRGGSSWRTLSSVTAQSWLGLSSTPQAGPYRSEPTQERSGQMVQQQSMREAERRPQRDSVRSGRTVPRVPVLLDFQGTWPPSRWSELPVGRSPQAGGSGRRPPAPPQSLRSAADGQPYKDNFSPWGHRSHHAHRRSSDSPQRSDAPAPAEPANGSVHAAPERKKRSRA